MFGPGDKVTIGGGLPVRSRTEVAAADAELCARLRAGDASAAQELLTLEYPVAVFFARAVAGDDRAERAVTEACEGLLSDVGEGVVSSGLRAALLRRIAVILAEVNTAAASPGPHQLRTFAEAGDRWEGWWDVAPPPWPSGVVPQPEQVLQALRRLPPEGRALLVLRHVAGLTAKDANTVLGREPDRHAALLELAREAYLVELDREVGADEDR